MSNEHGGTGIAPHGKSGLSGENRLRENPPYAYVLLLLFVLSGACGLIYEIAWTRQLTLIFGLSTYSVMTMLAAFMVGLSLGSLLFGRIIDARSSPLMVYGFLEAGIGIYALVFPALLHALQPLFTAAAGQIPSHTVLILFRMTCAFAVLLPATLLMGATFPVMNRIFITGLGSVGRQAGMLYAGNTFGAVIGAFLAGFILLKQFGIFYTSLTAVAGNILIGGAALLLSARTRPEPAKTPVPRRKEAQPGEPFRAQFGWLILLSAALSGFTFLAFETLATRILILALGNSTWAFSTILCCVLTGLAAGSAVSSRFYDRLRRRAVLLGSLQIAAAFLLVLIVPQWSWLEALNERLRAGGAGLSGYLVRQFAYSFVIVGIPTAVMGAVLPLCLKLYCASFRRLGGDIGRLYAVNTAGAVAGILITGLLLVPLIGVRSCFWAFGFMNLSLGGVILFLSPPPRKKARLLVPAGCLAACIGVLALLPADIRIGRTLPGYRLAYAHEGAGGLLTVFEAPDSTRVMNINNVTEVATDGVSLQTFRMMAALPAVMAPDMRDALVITFGAGIAAGALAEMDLRRLDCVEINPDIGKAAAFFTRENNGVIDNPRLNMVIEDGRNFLLTTREKYDLISADATHPTGADSWVLFTREFYRLCRSRLSGTGLFSQWLPLHGISLNNLKSILATVNAVFPHMQLWFTGMDRTVGHTLILASSEPLEPRFDRFREELRRPALRRLLQPFDLDNPCIFGQYYIGDAPHLAAFFSGAPLNTDDKAHTAFPDRILTNRDLIINLEQLLARRKPLPFSGAAPAENQTLRRYFRGMGDFWKGQLYLFQGNAAAAMTAFRQAAAENPENEPLARNIAVIARNVAGPALEAARSLESGKRYSRALEILHQVEAIMPEKEKPYGDIGRIYLQSGQPEKAREYLLRAAGTNAGYTVFFNLGLVYLEADSLRRAEWAFKQAVRLNTTLAEGYTNLGYVYYRMRDFKKARQAWETTLRLDPGNALAQQGLEKLMQ